MILPGSYANGFAPRDGMPMYPSLWKGCVGAWAPCLGPTGLTLRDWSGRGNHGTLTNMVPGDDWVTSQGKHALDFDASNDYVSIGAWTPISTTAPFSMSGWMKISGFSGNNYPSMFSLKSNAGELKIGISNDTSYLGILIGSNNASWGRFRNNLAASTWPGIWHHVGVAYSGSGPTSASSFTSYLDGVPIAMVDNAAPFGATFDLSMIGGDGGAASYMRGLLDSLFVHDRVLSSAEWRLLASRRGIAYELASRRRSSLVAGFNRRRRLLVGAGS